MKKVYVLLSAACVAVSASAVEKEMAVASQRPAGAGMVKLKADVANPNAKDCVKSGFDARMKAAATRAAGDCVYFRPAENLMSIGSSVNGYGYNVTFGFASSYGDLIFKNYSAGASSFEWEYTRLNDFEVVGDNADWTYSQSNDADLVVKGGVGQMLPPVLSAGFPSGDMMSYEVPNLVTYLCGGGADYWGFEDDLGGEFGVSFYQNSGFTNPDGYSGFMTMFNAYCPGQKGFNENGVYVTSTNPNNNRTWKTMLEQNTGASEVTDVRIENFTFIQPAPASTYFMNKAWVELNVEASADTQLISYIYPFNEEEGVIEEMPIAIGYASISKASKENPVNYAPVFEYYPLDENGDEIEGEVFIDGSVAITVEGFSGNDAITAVRPVSGYYNFSYEAYVAGNYDLCREPDMYVQLSFKADGEPASALGFDTGLYFSGSEKDQDTLSLGAYGQLTMNAVFPYIYEENGVDEVKIAAEGGSAEVILNALYYNVAALVEGGVYEVSAPEWLNVAFSEVDPVNGTTTMTVSAEADQVGREGVVTIEGIGAYYSLKVIQGEGNAVSSISIDRNAQYFDLQGRRVASPEKGLYIKKAGNKTSKVIL